MKHLAPYHAWERRKPEPPPCSHPSASFLNLSHPPLLLRRPSLSPACTQYMSEDAYEIRKYMNIFTSFPTQCALPKGSPVRTPVRKGPKPSSIPNCRAKGQRGRGKEIQEPGPCRSSCTTGVTREQAEGSGGSCRKDCMSWVPVSRDTGLVRLPQEAMHSLSRVHPRSPQTDQGR
jgi:hypothetical protein